MRRDAGTLSWALREVPEIRDRGSGRMSPRSGSGFVFFFFFSGRVQGRGWRSQGRVVGSPGMVSRDPVGHKRPGDTREPGCWGLLGFSRSPGGGPGERSRGATREGRAENLVLTLDFWCSTEHHRAARCEPWSPERHTTPHAAWPWSL